MTNRRRLVALAAAASLTLAACGTVTASRSTGEAGSAAAGSTETTQSPSPTTMAPSASTDATGDTGETGDLEDSESSSASSTAAADTFTTDDTQGGMAQGGGTLLPVEVRTGTHGDVTRVVVEFSGDSDSGWAAGYVDEALEQGRGEAIEVPGDAILAVTLRGLGIPESQEQTDAMIAGDLTANAPGVVGLHLDPVFEGQAVLYIGLDAEVPYEVSTLSDPQRVVVDIRTGA